MWTLFYGEATDATARVYARWDGPKSPEDDRQLVIRGPVCDTARTLPTNFKLDRRDDGIWQSTVVDPCFWSPALPARYQLLSEGERVPLAEIGIRRFGVQRNSLWLNRERWVLRATELPKHQTGIDLTKLMASLRDAHLSLVVDANHPELLALAEQASRDGVMLVVKFHDDGNLRKALQQLARWPAVAVGLVPLTASLLTEDLRQAAPNVLLAADLTASAPTTDAKEIPSWINLVVADADKPTLQALDQTLEHRALMVLRQTPIDAHGTPAEQRRACELLQQFAAPELDLAGYLVGATE